MKATIENGKPEDLKELAGITREEFAYVNPTLERVEKRFSDPLVRYCVARADGQLVGFVDFEQLSEQDFQVMGLAVRKEFRRKGLGTRLVEKALREIRALGGKTAQLYVTEENAAARKLYEGQGFQFLDFLEHEIDGKKALVMVKRL